MHLLEGQIPGGQWQIVRSHSCTSNSKGSTRGAQFQDKLLGKGNRVMNLRPKSYREPYRQYRCTVCGQTESVRNRNYREKKKDEEVAKAEIHSMGR